MGWLKNTIESNKSTSGKIFDLIIQALIILSLIGFSLDTLPNLGSSTRKILEYFEVITVSIFSVEYILRIYVANKKLKFIFSFYGIVDLLAILPFYISTGIDLRAVRTFRLLRLFRIFKLVRYNAAIRRLHKAVLIA